MVIIVGGHMSMMFLIRSCVKGSVHIIRKSSQLKLRLSQVTILLWYGVTQTNLLNVLNDKHHLIDLLLEVDTPETDSFNQLLLLEVIEFLHHLLVILFKC